LTGTLTDPSGASIPNATVTLTILKPIKAGRHHRRRRNVPFLSYPWNVSVRFSAPVLRLRKVSSFTVNVTETPVLDRAMEVGAQTEQVTVEANQEILQPPNRRWEEWWMALRSANQPLATRNYTRFWAWKREPPVA